MTYTAEKIMETRQVAAVTTVAPWSIAAAAEAEVKNIVIVHGAFADGSGWRTVSDILTKDGYKVAIVQEPLTSLAEDVAATKRVLDLQNGPSVLVGHSYGGRVISDAGNADNVRHWSTLQHSSLRRAKAWRRSLRANPSKT
jgi:pimeloyl-ACP methyl ester carboxylesterase